MFYLSLEFIAHESRQLLNYNTNRSKCQKIDVMFRQNCRIGLYKTSLFSRWTPPPYQLRKNVTVNNILFSLCAFLAPYDVLWYPKRRYIVKFSNADIAFIIVVM